jgi:hypothetical protein
MYMHMYVYIYIYVDLGPAQMSRYEQIQYKHILVWNAVFSCLNLRMLDSSRALVFGSRPGSSHFQLLKETADGAVRWKGCPSGGHRLKNVCYCGKT